MLTCKLLSFTAILESDDLRAVINEMDKAFNYSQKVSVAPVLLYAALLHVPAVIVTLLSFVTSTT